MKMNTVILQGFIVAVFSIFYRCTGMSYSYKRALYTNLTTNYNKDIPPILDQRNVVFVRMSLKVVSLNDIDEVSEQFSVSAFFTINWQDQLMVWKPADYGGITQLRISLDNVWIPEIILLNPTEKLKSLGTDWNKIRYHSTGQADWYPGDLLKASCTINVYYFPFDTQVCDLVMQVYGYGINEIKLFSSRDDVDLSGMAPHNAWIISKTEAYVTEFFSTSRVIFRFHFERRPQFVVVIVILPILFMCLLNVMVFLLPVDSGERIGFAITVLLAIAVYMTIVSDNLPKTSEPLPLISYLLIICLGVSVLITVVTVLNLRLFHKDINEPVPRWLINVYNIFTCRICSKKNSNKTMEKENAPQSKFEAENGHVPSNKVKVFLQTADDETQIETTPITWKDISTVIDYIALLITTLSLIISFAIIILCARNSSS